MKTEQILQKLTNEVAKPRGENIVLKQEDAKLILNRVNYLESVAAALLRSQINAEQAIVLPYQKKPEGF